jgi:hypothetical protein
MTDSEWWDKSKHDRMRGLSRLDRCYIKKRLWIGFLLMQLAGYLSPQDTVKAFIIARNRCRFFHGFGRTGQRASRLLPAAASSY